MFCKRIGRLKSTTAFPCHALFRYTATWRVAVMNKPCQIIKSHKCVWSSGIDKSRIRRSFRLQTKTPLDWLLSSHMYLYFLSPIGAILTVSNRKLYYARSIILDKWTAKWVFEAMNILYNDKLWKSLLYICSLMYATGHFISFVCACISFRYWYEP